MSDSLCDMFMKEHEKYLPVHGMIQASSLKTKTPYQLDLEVKDRKPNIVPKVGDMVKIKSREWYEKWRIFVPIEHVNVMYSFNSEMTPFCGKVLTVRRIDGDHFFLGNEETEIYWTFSLEMFEEVYPVQEQLSSKFPRIDLSCPLPLQSPLQVRGSELVLPKEEQERLKEQILSPCSEREKELLEKQSFFASKVEEVTKRISAYTLVQSMTAKPKLKQVKTTHLLRFKKL